MIKTQTNFSKTAILLFAFSNKLQSVVKPLSEFKEQNNLLWNAIYTHKIKTIQKTNLPFFLSNEKNQFGDNFGQKLNHSVQEIFNQGFDKVIIIGNDCLSLSKNDLLNANAILQKNDFVLGKDTQGGAYLIGVSKENYDQKNFENLSWQTKYLYQEAHLLFSKNNLEILAPKNDFNNQFQFKKALENLSFDSFLKRILIALFSKKNQPFVWLYNKIDSLSISINYNKGPPLLAYY